MKERPVSQLSIPAEWEPHRATWLAWPHNADTWPRCLPVAQREFADLVSTIGDTEPVCLLIPPGWQSHLATTLPSNNVHWFEYLTNDSWIRDFGPTFVRDANHEVRGINWTYNGWGEKYPPFERDRDAAAWILDQLGIPRVDSTLVFEGGAIEVNGEGVCLSTRSCLLNPNRNPGWTEDQAARELSRMLGCPSIVLIDPAVIPGDDTDGHIDQVARFATSQILLVAASQCDAVQSGLQAWQEKNGLDLAIEIRILPDPPAISMFGNRVPASYANFLIVNQRVIVPQFETQTDAMALGVIREAFPDREAVGLDSRYLAVGLGSFHCLTQQQPA